MHRAAERFWRCYRDLPDEVREMADPPYHTGIVFLLLFIVYQLYLYSYTRYAWLIVLSVFDIVIIYLTREEYKRVKRKGIFDR